MTDQTEDNDKGKVIDLSTRLTLIPGTEQSENRDKPSGRVGKAESGLTLKQEQFAQGLANGLSNSDAYRQAYDASNMKPNVVHVESCKLAAMPKIADRMNVLLQEKRNRHGILSEKQSERVWRNVWRLAEGDGVPPSVQQAALALAAKMAGMLTDKVEVKTESKDSKSLEAELLERLQRLTG
jgi:hypothetical protein